MKIADLHGRELGTALAEANYAVLPLGSLEYHGPHSPYGTDQILAEGFAELIDPESKPLIYPSIPFSPCPGKTVDYPGTVSIQPEVYIAYLRDVVTGICQLGIRNIVLLNAHDANMGPSRTVAEAVTAEYKDASFLLINWWQMAAVPFCEQQGLFQGTAGRGHGGPYEMSAVKALRPDLVAVEEEDEELDAISPLSPLPYVLVESAPSGWAGYTGRIQQTSLQAGKAIVAEAAKNMNLLICNWLEMRRKLSGERGTNDEL
ncbi:creatininase family protein [Brevibacillus humidisoli]|uniref:creatininase family protein n=1 Tax=Brevibacillus humidisoli TaxID=2895522 RepID=UPI001E3DD64B|nr:creatininase family protein [Brevibacillus humidisoli]UFJ39379.1 creatininase family protein [Brevibacillus humidisoli]